MKIIRVYWDASAIVETLHAPPPSGAGFEHVTRTHTLAECFSTLTGGRHLPRFDAGEVAGMLRQRAATMTLVDLPPAVVLDALDKARRRGVRGGAVHDYLHAVAAELHGAARILTLNIGDFRAVTRLPVAAP